MNNVLLVLASVGPAVLGQLLLKSSIEGTGATVESHGLLGYFMRVFSTPAVVLAFALYGVSALIWTVVLSKLDLSLAYPLVSMGYVLVVFFSWMFLKESVSPLRIVGLVIICSGVVVLSRS